MPQFFRNVASIKQHESKIDSEYHYKEDNYSSNIELAPLMSMTAI